MRDLINIIDFLTEGVALSASEITKYDKRFDKFIEKIKKGEPFTTVDGVEVVIDPVEAERFYDMRHVQNNFTGVIKAKIKGSTESIPISKLSKTEEFGGAAAAIGQEPSTAGKEALIVKPSQIGITDRDIPAHDLYEVIAKNPALNRTDYGKVVISLADYITSGEEVMLPEEYKSKDKEKVRKAIVDYAGEYLGVLALLYGKSYFPKRDQFEEWLGGNIGDLILNFPGKANTNLADSYAVITNPDTKHTINISSKGTGGGAAPAISGLKIPDAVKTDPNFAAAVEFIEICQTQGTIQQAFSAMDLIYSVSPSSIPKMWHKYLPFSENSPKLMGLATQSIASRKDKQPMPLPAKYQPIVRSIEGAGTDGGKVVYAIKKEVANSINSGMGIPGFDAAILETLEMNFIQQYVDYTSGELTFYTQWPAKLDGNITVENKSSSTDPTGGGFSFKLGRTDASVSREPGVQRVDPAVPQDLKPEQQVDVSRAGRKRR